MITCVSEGVKTLTSRHEEQQANLARAWETYRDALIHFEPPAGGAEELVAAVQSLGINGPDFRLDAYCGAAFHALSAESGTVSAEKARLAQERNQIEKELGTFRYTVADFNRMTAEIGAHDREYRLEVLRLSAKACLAKSERLFPEHRVPQKSPQAIARATAAQSNNARAAAPAANAVTVPATQEEQPVSEPVTPAPDAAHASQSAGGGAPGAAPMPVSAAVNGDGAASTEGNVIGTASAPIEALSTLSTPASVPAPADYRAPGSPVPDACWTTRSPERCRPLSLHPMFRRMPRHRRRFIRGSALCNARRAFPLGRRFAPRLPYPGPPTAPEGFASNSGRPGRERTGIP